MQTCNELNINLMTKLSPLQLQKLDELISTNILQMLEYICVPDMKGVSEEAYPYVFDDRVQTLFLEARNYIKNNL